MSLLGTLGLHAQPFQIGSTSITFNDPARGGRSIPTDIYYPATTAGSNTTVESGQFPVIAFGHGFIIGVGQYQWLVDELVPCGYIVALPTTEGGIPPNHGEFGADLAFLIPAIQAEGANASSVLFGAVGTTSALGGHSMGGGASFLGADNNTDITALFNFAAAETNPSAIAAAANVQVPTLIFEGSDDCVTPSNDHTGPMYNALNVDCKTLINITGGSHCQFANSDFVCGLGQLTCGGSISLADQEAEVMQYLKPWLDTFLKGDCDQLDAAAASAPTDPDITATWGCTMIDTCNVCLTSTNFSLAAICSAPPDSTYLAPNVLLEGPYAGGGAMNALLGSLIPLAQPYNVTPYSYAGTESLTSIPANMVDWVLIEARTGTPDLATKQTMTVETRAAILLDNGDVVDVDGTSPVLFENLYIGQDYYFCVRHRNHLDVLSGNATTAATNMTYDFSSGAAQAFGSNQVKSSGDGFFLMHGADYTQDHTIQNTDFDAWRFNSAQLFQYDLLDGNLDGVVQTTDYDLWFPNKSKLGAAEAAY